MPTILAITPRYPPDSLVGSYIATHEMLKYLQGRGFTVFVRTIDLRTQHHEYEGIDVDKLQHHMVGRTIHELGADMVLSHLGDTGEPHRIALQQKVPSVRMVHSIPRSRDEYLRGAALAVFNADATRQAVHWEGPHVIVHPVIDPDRYRTTPGDMVTLVNATREKGMCHVAEMALQMPDVRFLAIASDRGMSLPFYTTNGQLIPRTEDMRSVYGRTRILLMPSEKETWGRTAIEAAVSGIPTIAHPTDGLREALGPAGTFVDRDDIDGWCAAIRRLLEPGRWLAASLAAKARAEMVERARVGELERLAECLSCLTHAHV